MTDIVERLYDLHERFIFQGGSEFACKLADEMMALRTKAASWEKVFGHLGTADECGNEWIRLQDEIERLRGELAAEKQAHHYTGLAAHAEAQEVNRLNADLAASQAHIEKLREALRALSPMMIPGVTWSDELGLLIKQMVFGALALPHDNTALREYVEKEVERRMEAAGQYVTNDASRNAALKAERQRCEAAVADLICGCCYTEEEESIAAACIDAIQNLGDEK